MTNKQSKNTKIIAVVLLLTTHLSRKLLKVNKEKYQKYISGTTTDNSSQQKTTQCQENKNTKNIVVILLLTTHHNRKLSKANRALLLSLSNFLTILILMVATPYVGVGVIF